MGERQSACESGGVVGGITCGESYLSGAGCSLVGEPTFADFIICLRAVRNTNKHTTSTKSSHNSQPHRTREHLWAKLSRSFTWAGIQRQKLPCSKPWRRTPPTQKLSQTPLSWVFWQGSPRTSKTSTQGIYFPHVFAYRLRAAIPIWILLTGFA